MLLEELEPVTSCAFCLGEKKTKKKQLLSWEVIDILGRSGYELRFGLLSMCVALRCTFPIRLMWVCL